MDLVAYFLPSPSSPPSYLQLPSLFPTIPLLCPSLPPLPPSILPLSLLPPPSLQAILKLPGDRALLQQLEQTVRKLISQERDPDASQAVRDAVLELDRIEVAMEMVRPYSNPWCRHFHFQCY